MAVFLTVLKVLLWIILILLGIVLLLILMLLFCPIRYRLKGEMYGERIEVSAKVRFIIISVIANFSKASGLDYAGKVLGIKVYPKKSKTKKPKKKGKSKSDEAALPAVTEKPDFEDTIVTPDSAVTESAANDNAAAGAKADKADKGDKKTDIKSDDKSEKKSESPKPITDAELDEALGTQDKAEGQNEGSNEIAEKQEGPGKLTQIKNKAVEAVGKASDKAEKIVSSTGEKIEKLETKIDHFVQFLDKPFTQKTIKRVKKLIVRVLKTVKPKKSRADITFGLSNAGDTGMMLGKIYQFYPLFYKWLRLNANFYEKGVEGEFDISGRIRLAFIVFPALRIILSKDFKRTRNLAKKI